MTKLDDRSLYLRKLMIETLLHAGRGHLASALSLVEILRVLYDDFMKYDHGNPRDPDRDRFILSKGHGCLALYAILADKGFFPKSELRNFCARDSILGGHPEYGKIPGVETSTGALGHGLPLGIGFALNAKYEKNEYRTIVVLGDGECQEGSVWEAALSAAQHKLNNLLVIVDYNKLQSAGAVADIAELEPFSDKWRSFGFAVKEVDGHKVDELRTILNVHPFHSSKPSALICHTTKGYGIPFIENDLSWHHKSRLKDEEITALQSIIGETKCAEHV